MEIPKSKNGYCPVCRRKLKSKASIERGIGPKCEHRLSRIQDGGSEQLSLSTFFNNDMIATNYKRPTAQREKKY